LNGVVKGPGHFQFSQKKVLGSWVESRTLKKKKVLAEEPVFLDSDLGEEKVGNPGGGENECFLKDRDTRKRRESLDLPQGERSRSGANRQRCYYEFHSKA